MVRLYGSDPPIEYFPEFYRRVSEQIEAVWPRCLELGMDAVLDFGFWSRRQRDKTRELVAEIGAQVRLYNLACPDDRAWERIERRNTDLNGGLFIARNTFEVLKARFEPLENDEVRVEVCL
jgi:predicted kinase